MPFGGQSQQRWGDNTVNNGEYIRDFQLTDLSGRVCHTGPARAKTWLLLAFFSPEDPASGRVLPLVQALADGEAGPRGSCRRRTRRAGQGRGEPVSRGKRRGRWVSGLEGAGGTRECDFGGGPTR